MYLVVKNKYEYNIYTKNYLNSNDCYNKFNNTSNTLHIHNNTDYNIYLNNYSYDLANKEFVCIIILVISFLACLFVTTLIIFHFVYLTKGISTYITMKYDELLFFHGNIFGNQSCLKNIYIKLFKFNKRKLVTRKRLKMYYNCNINISTNQIYFKNVYISLNNNINNDKINNANYINNRVKNNSNNNNYYPSNILNKKGDLLFTNNESEINLKEEIKQINLINNNTSYNISYADYIKLKKRNAY